MMTKISFKTPKGTFYFAKIGFDWGAFWGFLVLGGLPFFLRKMNMLGFYSLGMSLILTISFLIPDMPDGYQYLSVFISFLFGLGISIYLGISGGRLTASHYIEEGYKLEANDEALKTIAKNEWGMV